MRHSSNNRGTFGALMALLIIGVLTLGACSQAKNNLGTSSQLNNPALTAKEADTANQLIAEPEPPEIVTPVVFESQSEGSLWKASGAMNGLFINPKARNVGDVLTIKVVESSSATNQALTTTDRTSSLSAGVTGFFNAEKRFPADQPFFNPFSKVAGSFESEFEGAGTTKRRGDLSAYITVRVIEVLPNGNLKVKGSREVTVNKEKQLITLIGIVRSRDISSENMILSTYISDAQIIYDGVGVVNDRQKPGWLTALLLKVWPF